MRRVLLGLVVIWSIAYFGFNDETLGSLVSYAVTSSVRGQFKLRRIHFPYLGGLWSLLTDAPARCLGEDFTMLDPDGNLAMRVDGVETDVKLRTLVLSLLPTIWEGKLNLTLHFMNARGPRGMAIVAPTRSTWGKAGEINIPATMSGKGPPGAGSNLTIIVEGVDLDSVDFGIGFADAATGQPSFAAALNNAKVHASLIYKSRRDLDTAEGPYLFFEVGPVIAPSGSLQIGQTLHFPLERIAAAQFGSELPLRGNLAFAAVARSRHGDATISGSLRDIFTGQGGVRLELAATNGGGMLRQLPQPVGRWLYGPASATLKIAGPFSRVAFDGQIKGALANLEGLQIDGLESGFHMECGRLEFPRLVGRAGGGKVTGTVRVQLGGAPAPKRSKKSANVRDKLTDEVGCPLGGKPEWRADLKLEGVDPERVPWVPRNVAKDVAGTLSGALKLAGSLVDHPEVIRIEEIDAVLDRRVAKLLPRRLKLGGGFRYLPGAIKLDDLSASAEGLRVAVLGEVSTRTLAMAGRARIDGAEGGAWVKRLWADPRLRVGRLAASGKLGGRLDRPQLELDVELADWLYGGRKLDGLTARLRLIEGELVIDQAHGRVHGGMLSGDVSVHWLQDGDVRKVIADPPIRVGIGLTGAEAKGLLGSSIFGGQLDFDARLHGTLHAPAGAAEASVRGFSVLGDPYDRAELRAELTGGVLHLADVKLARRGGGALSAGADFGPADKLAATIAIEQAPWTAIPGLAKLPWALIGLVSAAVTVDGTLAAPRIGGTITVDETTLRKVGLGKGKLELRPTDGKFAVTGQLFDRLQIEGEVRLQPTLGAHFAIRFVDLALESVVPELQTMANTHGVISGGLTVDYEPSAHQLAMALVLNKVDLVVEGQTDEEASRVLLVRNQGDIKLRSDGARLFVEQAELKSLLGSLRVDGVVDEEQSRLVVRGRLGLELAQYFLRGLFNHMSGDATVDLRLEGPIRRPRFYGALDLAKVEVEPRGLEHAIRIPSGHASFTGQRVQLDHLRVVLDGHEAKADGQILIAGIDVKELGLHVAGKLSAKLLTWALPEQVGEARGAIGVDVQVTGTPQRPQLRGRANLSDVTMELRKLDREVRVKEGSVQFTPDGQVVLGCPKTGAQPSACKQVTGLFDGESPFFGEGRFFWDGLDLSRVDLTAELRGYNHSTADYSLSLSPRVRLRSVGRGLELSGRIDIIEGRYHKQFDVLRDLVIRPRVVEKSIPFWTGIPLLEEMRLQLSVQSTPGTLIVKNNIAELGLSAYLDISGTLADPRLDGAVQMEEGGSFKIPALRAEFVTNRGQATFDATKRVPSETPRLDLTATAEMLDRGDVAHTIILRLLGTINKPEIQVASLEGWDMSTTIAFLLAGRTPDELRRQLSGSDPTVRLTGAASSSGADGLTKSASGVLLSNVISDPLKRTIGLDIASIEVGTKSVDIRLCKRFGRWIKMCGTGEIGFLGSSRLDARGELKLLDPLLLMLRVEYLTRGVETLQEVQSRLKFELNYRLPLGY